MHGLLSESCFLQGVHNHLLTASNISAPAFSTHSMGNVADENKQHFSYLSLVPIYLSMYIAKRSPKTTKIGRMHEAVVNGRFGQSESLGYYVIFSSTWRLH